ncbi:MAG: uracil-DNA glycosylase [Cyclobacteriaceae bacterium]|jgi:uracil-DNA glycosylase
MKVNIEDSWRKLLKDEFEKDYFKDLVSFVKEEYQSQTVFPPGSQIFQAFDRTPLQQVKVVILGQDPYHGQDQAHGLCFSVNEGKKFPRSLLNIFKELKADLGMEIPPHGDLSRWADQGVLLLNATLTVRASLPGSHQKKGWEEFTDAVIKNLSEIHEGLVFVLWGAYAQKKGELIDTQRHLVLKSAHPSPFSAERGFFGNSHFSKVNNYLKEKGVAEIEW